jgi:hypothetical protein
MAAKPEKELHSHVEIKISKYGLASLRGNTRRN